jgi:hypothetical protein
MLQCNRKEVETSLVIELFGQRRSAMVFVGHKHGSERPYPGQLWRQAHVHVIVVAVSPNTIFYEDLSRGTRVTESVDDFLITFCRIRR